MFVITVNHGYGADGMGRVSRINVISGSNQSMPAVGANGLLDQTFAFDSVGNLVSRSLNAPAGAGAARTESETFGYDTLDRFINHTVSGFTDASARGANTNGYDSAGNLTSKSGMPMGYTAGSNRLCNVGASSANCAANATGNVLYDGVGNITRYTRPSAAQAPNVPGADGATILLQNYTAFNLPMRITRSLGSLPI